jgi:hypothetical protein
MMPKTPIVNIKINKLFRLVKEKNSYLSAFHGL